VVGSASRNPGTLMAVSEAGTWCGSLSGGCVEAAVVGEARRVIGNGRAEVLRLGAGSPLIDIRLPCGGGLDLLIMPEPDGAAVACALATLEQRRTVALRAGLDGSVSSAADEPQRRTTWDGRQLTLRIDPVLRIVAIGQGDEVVAMARLGLAYGADVLALTPDQGAAEAITALGGSAQRLQTPAASSLHHSDAATAVIFLFHDHDWEQALLGQALVQPALLIGAMGSSRTHALRLEGLRGAGVPEPLLARIEGPLGLIAMTRDPETLALSVLARVAEAYQAHCDRVCDAAGNRIAGRSLDTLSAI